MIISGDQLVCSRTMLEDGERFMMTGTRSVIATDEKVVSQNGDGLPFFQVHEVQPAKGIPNCWLGKTQVNVLMMMGAEQEPEWTDPETGDRWISDAKTERLVAENDSRISWYRGTPYRKVEESERTGRQDAYEKVQKALRLCEQDERWFAQVRDRYAGTMGRLASRFIEEFHGKTVPDADQEMSAAEGKVAQAFASSSPLQEIVESLESELVRIRKTEDQVKGLLDRYWGTLAEIDGATFSVQFDRLDPEYTLRRGYWNRVHR